MSEWPLVSLGDVVTLNYGKGLRTQDREVGNIPVYSSAGLTGYHSSPLIESSGIIIGRKGTVGSIHMSNGSFWCIDTAYYILPDPNKYDFVYLYYLLNTLGLNDLNEDSAVPGLNRETAYSQKFNLPNLVEQKAIASVLSSLDDKIDLLHRQNKTLESMAETLFRQWFVAEAQEDWPEVKLSHYVELNKSSINKKYEYPFIQYLDTSSLTRGYISTLQLLPLLDAPSRAKRLVKKNDILLSTVRPDQCHFGILLDPPENLVASTGFCIISCKMITPFFAYYLLTSKEMTDYLHSIAEGSTSTYPSLKSSDIGSIKFLMPDIEKLQNFHQVAKNNWNKIDSNSKKIKNLENLRDTLLPKLMSGEIRVKYEQSQV